MNTEKLDKLGFKKASDTIKDLRERKRKMVIAYEHFRYVRPEKIDAFNEKLREDTLKEDKNAYHFNKLGFIKVEEYPEVPPDSVLTKIEKAQEFKCFDYFEIAKIEARIEVKDPIVFGRIEGCPDRFYVAQWNNDVKIEDILKENEG